MKTRALRLTSVTVAVWLAAHGTATACPVCVGVSDSPLASGMNAGVLVLLGVTASVLGAIFLAGRRVLLAPSAVDASGDGSSAAAPSAQHPAANSEAGPC